MDRAANFEAFWQQYLALHRQPATQALHLAGTTLAGLALLGFMLTGEKRYLAYAVVGGYGPAWLGHFAFERNRPATFTHPLWSLRADLSLYRLWLEGRLPEVAGEGQGAVAGRLVSLPKSASQSVR